MISAAFSLFLADMVGAAPRPGQNLVRPRDRNLGSERRPEDVEFLLAEAGAGAGCLANGAVILDERKAFIVCLARHNCLAPSAPDAQGHKVVGEGRWPVRKLRADSKQPMALLPRRGRTFLNGPHEASLSYQILSFQIISYDPFRSLEGTVVAGLLTLIAISALAHAAPLHAGVVPLISLDILLPFGNGAWLH